jgi:hypothetical protein
VQLSVTVDAGTGTWELALDGALIGSAAGPSATALASTDSAQAALRLEFAEADPGRLDSARFVAVCLEDGDCLTLSALRPPGAKGQDRDEISVALPESRREFSVFDPRLSTEYSGSGAPRRFGIELWLGDDPDGDQHPWRLGGEATGAAPFSHGPLRAYAMSVHSAERSGVGLYVVVSGR